MTIEGSFPNGDRVIGWSTETTRKGDTMRLSLETTEVPSSLSISNLTFTILTPTDVRAASLGGLENKKLTIGPVDVTVNGIDLLEGGAGIEFELSPLIYSSRLVVSGVQEVTLGVEGNVMRDQGFTSSVPRGMFSCRESSFPFWKDLFPRLTLARPFCQLTASSFRLRDRSKLQSQKTVVHKEALLRSSSMTGSTASWRRTG